MRVFSLCNGTQERWKDDAPKQICDILGEPLLLRTNRQVLERGYKMEVVSHNPFLLNFASFNEISIMPVPKTDKLVSTILLTAPLSRVTFLLGDVFFTDEAIDTIFRYDGDLQFFGTKFELFALVVGAERLPALFEQMQETELKSRGKLWHLLRCVSGVEWEKHEPEKLKENPYHTLIDDLSDDMDTVQQYLKLINKLKRG